LEDSAGDLENKRGIPTIVFLERRGNQKVNRLLWGLEKDLVRKEKLVFIFQYY